MHALTGADIFDGDTLHRGRTLLIDGGRAVAIADRPPADVAIVTLTGIVAPGFVDTQVNGGGGVMLNQAPTPATLRRIAAAHRTLGTAWLLPTLITDRPDITTAALLAATSVAGTDGIAGLHLEGPHLSLARKGAHDPALIRPMTAADLAQLIDFALQLPTLMVTVAPESVTPSQIAAMAAAGIVVSLGHTDADHRTVLTAVEAGARCATHLYNAMSQMTARAPGLVGAVLSDPRLRAGIIADGIHVHPAALRAALSARPGGLFLVTDSMAVAGTDAIGFQLNNRPVQRRDGRLTLEDGTLAGADLDMLGALRTVTGLGVPLDAALRMATTGPAAILRDSLGAGRLIGQPVGDLQLLNADLSATRWLDRALVL